MKKYFYATFVTLLYVPIVTIGAELLPPFKNFLKAIFWHHWLGKSMLLIVLYAVLLGIFSLTARNNESELAEARKLSWALALGILGSVSIFLFFTYEFATHG